MSKGFSEEEVAQFQETFNMYDADGGGKLTSLTAGLTVMAAVSFSLAVNIYFCSTVARQAAIIFIYDLF